jgi:hypothetical protein
MELRCHLLELEECLRSWENSTNFCARAQRRIQVQRGAVHALTDLVSMLTVYFGTPNMFITLWFGFDYGTNPPLGTLII